MFINGKLGEFIPESILTTNTTPPLAAPEITLRPDLEMQRLLLALDQHMRHLFYLQEELG